MKEIKLNSKYNITTQVDSEDYEELSQYKWQCIKSRSGKDIFYILRWLYLGKDENGKHIMKSVYMHRQIMGLEDGDKRQIDHIDHDPTNNQKSNLRICTKRQNCQNSEPSSKKILGIKGVSIVNGKTGVTFCVSCNGKTKNFKNLTDATLYYNKLAKENYKEFAYLNPIQAITDALLNFKIPDEFCYQLPHTGRWKAGIFYDNKNYNFGTYPTEQEARTKILLAKELLKIDFNKFIEILPKIKGKYLRGDKNE